MYNTNEQRYWGATIPTIVAAATAVGMVDGSSTAQLFIQAAGAGAGSAACAYGGAALTNKLADTFGKYTNPALNALAFTLAGTFLLGPAAGYIGGQELGKLVETRPAAISVSAPVPQTVSPVFG